MYHGFNRPLGTADALPDIPVGKLLINAQQNRKPLLFRKLGNSLPDCGVAFPCLHAVISPFLVRIFLNGRFLTRVLFFQIRQIKLVLIPTAAQFIQTDVGGNAVNTG